MTMRALQSEKASMSVRSRSLDFLTKTQKAPKQGYWTPTLRSWRLGRRKSQNSLSVDYLNIRAESENVEARNTRSRT
jgi:hypothetical protein